MNEILKGVAIFTGARYYELDGDYYLAYPSQAYGMKIMDHEPEEFRFVALGLLERVGPILQLAGERIGDFHICVTEYDVTVDIGRHIRCGAVGRTGDLAVDTRNALLYAIYRYIYIKTVENRVARGEQIATGVEQWLQEWLPESKYRLTVTSNNSGKVRINILDERGSVCRWFRYEDEEAERIKNEILAFVR